MSSVCKIPNCVNDMQCPSTGLCKQCHSSMYRAGRQPESWRVKRLNNLLKYQARTQLMSTTSHITKRKMVTLNALPGQVRLKKRRKLYVA